MPTKLTDTYLRGMAPNTEERDAIAEGLVARKRADALSFVFQFQLHGQRKKLTLGKYGDGKNGLTLAEARKRATAMRSDLGYGRMPHAATAKVETVNDLLDRYVANLRETTKRPDQVAYLLDAHIRPRIGAFDFAALRRDDIQAAIHAVTRPQAARKAKDGKPATKAKKGSVSVAAAVGKYLAAAMNFGESAGLIEQGIHNLRLPTSKTPPKQTVLTEDQLPTLLHDWMTQGPETVGARWPFGPQCLLMLLTGARSSEISELRWHEIDESKGLIVLSPERSKGGRETTLVLSSFAFRVIRALPRFDDDAVFPSLKKRALPGKVDEKPGRSGRGFWCGHARATEDCRARTKIDGWSRHSLRRTCRTGLSGLKVPPHVANAVLNHAPPRLQDAYDKHDYIEERREALEAWGARVFALAGWL